MIFQIISIVCNLIALILLIICYRLHKTFLENAIDRENLIVLLNIVQKEFRESNNSTCKYFKDKGNMKAAIEWQYFTDGNDNAINYLRRIIKDKTRMKERIDRYLERNKNEKN